MAKFLNRSSKALIILSCTSILGSFIEVPLAFATEIVQPETLIGEVVTENNIISFMPTNGSELEKEFQTTLTDSLSGSTTLSGKTIPTSFVKIVFEDLTESTAQSDEDGIFTIENFRVASGDEFTVSISNTEGTLLEDVGFTVYEAETVEEAVAEIIEPVTAVEETETVIEDPAEEVVGEQVEPVQPESAPQEQVQTFSTFSIMSVPVDEVGTKYYYVLREDTLYSIAKKYNVNIEDLKRWNNLKDAGAIKAGDIISINGTNDYDNFDKEDVSFTSRTQFLDYISKYAKEIGANYDLYASIMIAQAALETGYGTSELATRANNFFGIKAEDGYQGYSIVMPTWEWVNGKRIDIQASFRFYPTFYQSLLDNAEKLRKGVSWDSKFYNGTWVENTNNFKDATLFLTGRYATDVRYYYKLNDIILSNNLTRHDEKAYRDNAYSALITSPKTAIGNMPLDHVPSSNEWYSNIKTNANTNDYFGAFVTVSHVSRNGKYANIYLNGTELGWVHTDAITTINLEIENVNYEAYLTSAKGNINSLPLGQAGTKVVNNTGNYLNKKVHVTSQTKDGLQSFLTVNGEALGWTSTSNLGKSITPYSVTIVSGKYDVNNVPWGYPGFVKLATTQTYMGQELRVIAKSADGYNLLSANGVIIGWVDSRAIQAFSYTEQNYQSYITNGNYEVDSLPWGSTGFKKLGNTGKYLGKKATITKESSNKAYVYATVEGKTVGWIDKKAFGLSGGAYEALITSGKYNIDSLPWGTPGFTRIGYTSDIMSEYVQIAGATQNGAYLLMRKNGKDTGWIDKRAVTRFESVPVSYSAYVANGSYEIDTLPWGESGFKKVGQTASILGHKVTITRESKNRAYAYTLIDGKPVGWVDKKAFVFKSSPYTAIISNGNYEVNSLPWGTPGFKLLAHTSAYLGKKIEIAGSTASGSYLLARVDGKDIGWIDHRSVVSENATAVNYSTTVKNGAYEINSLPWGVKGFKYLGKTASLVGKNVQVTLESSNKAYVYVFSEGKAVGWIDKRAFK